MRTVVFLDLDNTFWGERTGVPQSALDAIHAAQALGHLVLSNTGRARGGTRELLCYGLDGRCYAAGAEAFLGAEKIVDRPLGIEQSRFLCDYLDIGQGILIAEGGDRCFVRPYDREYFEQLRDMLASLDDPFIDHPDIAQMNDDDHAQVYKYSLWIRGGVPERLKSGVAESYNATTMGDATEFTQKHISKATILDTVRTILEQRLGEPLRTMAVGDSGNDIPMLRGADLGICMGNGTDEAKAAADLVCRPIDQDGLAHAFELAGLTRQ